MAELDFDELDKAVNDLMANVDTSKRPAGLDDPEDKVVTIASTDTTGPAAANEPVATPISGTSAPVADMPAAAPALAVKRRGQFMDMIHPSSDMTTSNRPTSRQGVTIQPVKSDTTTTSTELSMASEPATPPESSNTPTEEVASPSATEWPDPIDMATEDVEPSTQAAEPTTPAEDPVATPEEQPSGPASEDEAAPLTSPFLTDAKVEKRPLGGNASPTTELVEKDAQVAPAEATPPVVLPEELAGDVMAVEAKDLSAHPETPKPSAIGTKATEAAASSITQQYTEQSSSGDQTNGSIYDTATYHQAIDTEKPAKKSSALKWIIWIVVLLLVGAAGGAAYFYFTR